MVAGALTKPDRGRSFITTTLFLAGYVTNPPSIAAALLLIDIAETFQKPVGIMSQMNTSSSILAISAALVMAALSVKYQHTILMQVGLAACALFRDKPVCLTIF